MRLRLISFNEIILVVIHHHWIIMKIIRWSVMVLARLLMVTSAHIIWKGYFPLAIYVLDKTLLLSTVRA